MLLPKNETNVLGICAIVFAVLGGALGLALGIIGLCIYKEAENRKLCKIAIIIVAVEIGLSILISILSIVALLGIAGSGIYEGEFAKIAVNALKCIL